jgi:hypothetical protein
MAGSVWGELWRVWLRLLVVGLWGCFSVVALGQVGVPDTSVTVALRNLASRAGVAFAGQVTQVNRVGGVVEVVFRVDTPLLGSLGASYTLREWSGLWSAGQSRYSVGQRMVIFLYAPGKAGLSSPVDGMEGMLPIVQASADSEPLLDVRRLAARVVRMVRSPMVDAEGGAMSVGDVTEVVAGWQKPIVREPVRLPLPVGVVPVRVAPVTMGPVLAPMGPVQ